MRPNKALVLTAPTARQHTAKTSGGRDDGRARVTRTQACLRDRRAEGRAEEAARSVLTVLRVRGIAVPDAARERILAQKDPERLERWLEKAIVAASVGEVLDDPS